MIGIESNKTELYPYNDKYKERADKIIKVLESIFGDLAVKIEHVGSTAITSIKSKPIIDIVIGVNSLNVVNQINNKLEQNEFIFSKIKLNGTLIAYKCENDGKRTHNVYVVLYGKERWKEFVLFRDFLNAHPDVAKEYEMLKEKLSIQYKGLIHEYTEGKDEFIKNVLKEASII